MKKLITWLLVFVFSFTSIVSANTLSSFQSPVVQQPPYVMAPPLSLNPLQGKIEEVYRSPESGVRTPIIYVIQDAHESLDAQENINQILNQLVDEGVTLVMFEGGSEKLDRSFYKIADDPNINHQVWKELFDEGSISGLEWFSANSPQEVQLFGIENEDIYLRNITQIQTVYELREETQPSFREMEKAIQRNRGKFYTGNAKKVLDLKQKFDDEKISLLTYAKDLSRWANKISNLDLTNPNLQDTWPQLVRLSKLMELETDHNSARYPTDPELALFFNAAQLQQFKGHLRWYFEHLIDEININLGDYPNLKNWIGFHVLQDELNAKELFHEIKQLQSALLERLEVSEEARRLMALEEEWNLLKKLIHLKLTRAEWQQIKAQQFVFDEQLLQGGIQQLVQEAIRNYQFVEARDGAFSSRLKNYLKQMKAQKAAVVLGGFHTEPMKQFLKDNNMGYVLVSPSIQNLKHKLNYYERMKNITILDVSQTGLPVVNASGPRLEKERNRLRQYVLVKANSLGSSPSPTLEASGIDGSLEGAEIDRFRDATTIPTGSAVGLQLSLDQLASSWDKKKKPARRSTEIPERIGKYQVTGVLGEGAMGVVYEAYDDELKRSVAIKVLDLDTTSSRAEQRFIHEGNVLSRIDHANVIRFYELGRTENGKPYYVMEKMEESLKEKIEEKKRYISIRAAQIAREVLLGLAKVHASGVIHRDIKPSNIMISSNGTAKLSDLGLSKEAGQASITRANAPVGTLRYMSPEQARGDLKRVNETSDIYAMGAVLYTMVTGSPPYAKRGKTFQEVAPYIIKGKRLGFGRHVKKGLRAIIMKAMSNKPNERYATAEAFIADIDRFLQGDPIEVKKPSALQRFLVNPYRKAKATVGGAQQQKEERQTAEYWINLAEINLRLDPNHAIVFLEEALRINPQSLRAKQLMGRNKMATKDYREAMEHYEQALSDNQQSFEIIYALGELNLKLSRVILTPVEEGVPGQFQRSQAEDFDEWSQLMRQNLRGDGAFMLLRDRAFQYMHQARNYFKQLIEHSPNRTEGYLGLAELAQYRMNDAEEKTQRLQAYKMDPVHEGNKRRLTALGVSLERDALTGVETQEREVSFEVTLIAEEDGAQSERELIQKFEQVTGYQILEKLGEGASGIVYKVKKPEETQPVAAKILLRNQSVSAREGFRNEAALLATLNHPHIVRIRGFGASEEIIFYTMDLGEETLEAKIKNEGALPLETVTRMGRQLAEALKYMHSLDIIHRDVKPSNVIWRGKNQVQLTDFSLAAGGEEEVRTFSEQDQVVGTPAYMSPEQARGDPLETVEEQKSSDVYSLGATLYALSTGSRPFKGNDPYQILEQVKAHNLTPPREVRPQISEDLEAIILKAMNPDPKERYNSAEALIEDLNRHEQGEVVAARTLTRTERVKRGAKEIQHSIAKALFRSRVLEEEDQLELEASRHLEEAKYYFQLALSDLGSARDPRIWLNDAVHSAQKALKIAPHSSRAHLLLGSIYKSRRSMVDAHLTLYIENTIPSINRDLSVTQVDTTGFNLAQTLSMQRLLSPLNTQHSIYQTRITVSEEQKRLWEKFLRQEEERRRQEEAFAKREQEEAQRDLELAHKHLAQAQKLNPGLLLAHGLREQLFASQQQWTKALEQASKVLQLHSENQDTFAKLVPDSYHLDASVEGYVKLVQAAREAGETPEIDFVATQHLISGLQQAPLGAPYPNQFYERNVKAVKLLGILKDDRSHDALAAFLRIPKLEEYAPRYWWKQKSGLKKNVIAVLSQLKNKQAYQHLVALLSDFSVSSSHSPLRSDDLHPRFLTTYATVFEYILLFAENGQHIENETYDLIIRAWEDVLKIERMSEGERELFMRMAPKITNLSERIREVPEEIIDGEMERGREGEKTEEVVSPVETEGTVPSGLSPTQPPEKDRAGETKDRNGETEMGRIGEEAVEIEGTVPPGLSPTQPQPTTPEPRISLDEAIRLADEREPEEAEEPEQLRRLEGEEGMIEGQSLGSSTPESPVLEEGQGVKGSSMDQSLVGESRSGARDLTESAIPASGSGVAGSQIEFEWVDVQQGDKTRKVKKPKWIDGRYRVTEVLGVGAMGVVYGAVDTQSANRSVAVKVLKQGLRGQARKRFIREAQNLARVVNPNVVRVYDIGVSPEVGQYFVMERVDGITLKEGGEFPQKKAIELVQEALSGLEAMHQAGLVHRDLKPSNIMAVKGQVKITDFGLSKSPENITLTRDNAKVGTPQYMSPEQFENPRLIDVRTDVYAMGAVLFELIEGSPPFKGKDLEVQKQVVEGGALKFKNIKDPRLQSIIKKAMAKEQDDRYESAASFQEELNNYASGDPIIAEPPKRRSFLQLMKDAASYVAEQAQILLHGDVDAQTLRDQSDLELDLARELLINRKDIHGREITNHLEAALKIDPNSSELARITARFFWYGTDDRTTDQGDFLLDRAIELNPRSWRAHHLKETSPSYGISFRETTYQPQLDLVQELLPKGYEVVGGKIEELITDVSPVTLTVSMMQQSLLGTATRDEMEKIFERMEKPQAVEGYKLGEVIGEGSSGLVFEARHEGLSRPVALKVLNRTVLTEDEATQFQNEISALEKVTDVGVVQVLGSGILPDGRPYFAMELLSTRTLEEELRDLEPEDRTARLARFAEQIAGTLETVHGQGVIHRDIKPENLLIANVGGERHVKITDFGIAQQLDEEQGLTLTIDDAVLGTPAYMSPEQARGQAVDHRSDIYSLGATLYHLASGHSPYEGADMQETLLRKAEGDSPTPIRELVSDISDGLAAIIERAMATDPAARYQSAKAMQEELGQFLAGEAITPTQSKIAKRKPKKKAGWFSTLGRIRERERRRANPYYELAQFRFEQENYEEARDHYLHVVENVAPHHSRAHMGLAYTYLKLDDKENAIKHFKEALQYNRYHVGAYKQLAKLYREKEKWHLAADHLAKAMELLTESQSFKNSIDIGKIKQTRKQFLDDVRDIPNAVLKMKLRTPTAFMEQYRDLIDAYVEAQEASGHTLVLKNPTLFKQLRNLARLAIPPQNTQRGLEITPAQREAVVLLGRLRDTSSATQAVLHDLLESGVMLEGVTLVTLVQISMDDILDRVSQIILGQVDLPTSVFSLQKIAEALTHEDVEVKKTAITQMIQIAKAIKEQTAGIVREKNKDFDNEKKIEEIINETITRHMVEPLITKLSDETMQKQAREALVELGESAIPALEAMFDPPGIWGGVFHDVERLVKFQISYILGQISSPESARVLLKAYDQVRRIQEGTGDAFYLIAQKQTAKRLEDEIVRSFQTLDGVAITALVEALEGEDISLRERAVEVLGKIKTSASIEALIPALGSTDESIRALAAEMLNRDYHRTAPIIIEQLTNQPNWRIRRAAIELLTRDFASSLALAPSDNREILDNFLALSEDPEWRVREKVVLALREALKQVSVEPIVLETLLKMLGDKKANVRVAATLTLKGVMFTPQEKTKVLSRLQELFDDENEDVRKAAALAFLARTKDHATADEAKKITLNIINRELSDPNPKVRERALYLFERMAIEEKIDREKKGLLLESRSPEEEERILRKAHATALPSASFFEYYSSEPEPDYHLIEEMARIRSQDKIAETIAEALLDEDSRVSRQAEETITRNIESMRFLRRHIKLKATESRGRTRLVYQQLLDKIAQQPREETPMDRSQWLMVDNPTLETWQQQQRTRLEEALDAFVVASEIVSGIEEERAIHLRRDLLAQQMGMAARGSLNLEDYFREDFYEAMRNLQRVIRQLGELENEKVAPILLEQLKQFPYQERALQMIEMTGTTDQLHQERIQITIQALVKIDDPNILDQVKNDLVNASPQEREVIQPLIKALTPEVSEPPVIAVEEKGTEGTVPRGLSPTPEVFEPPVIASEARQSQTSELETEGTVRGLSPTQPQQLPPPEVIPRISLDKAIRLAAERESEEAEEPQQPKPRRLEGEDGMIEGASLGTQEKYHWITLEQGIESVQTALREHRPKIMELYDQIDALDEEALIHFREEIYATKGKDFSDWEITSALSNQRAPYFESSVVKTLILSLPKLKLDPLGFGLHWTTPETGIASVRYRMKLEIPKIMEEYDRFEELTEGEIQLLRDQIYKIKLGHLRSWGLASAVGHEAEAYFEESTFKVLSIVFEKLKLNPLAYELDFTTEDKALASVQYALRQNYPSLMEDYDQWEKLQDYQQEKLKEKVYQIKFKHFKAMGLRHVTKKGYFGGHYEAALIAALPKMDLNPLGFNFDWTTPERAKDTLRFVFEKRIPNIMNRYSRVEELGPQELAGLREDIYKQISDAKFRLWGIRNVIKKQYFGDNYYDVIATIFDHTSLGVSAEGMRAYRRSHTEKKYNWPTGDQSVATANIQTAFEIHRPDIMDAYRHFEELKPEEVEELKSKLYDITAGHFADFGLNSALVKAAVPVFEGHIFKALNLTFPKLQLNPLEFALDFSSREKALASMRHQIKKHNPKLLERYDQIDDDSSEQEKDALREDVYSLSNIRLDLWGLTALNRSEVTPYFEGSYMTSLQIFFEKLELNRLGFRFDWTSSEKARESVLFVISREKPGIIFRYNNRDGLDEIQLETLRKSIYRINSYDFSAWGIGQVRTNNYFGKDYPTILMNIFDAPSLALTKEGFKKRKKLRYQASSLGQGEWNALDEALKTLHTVDLDEIQGDITLGIILEEKFEASPGLRESIQRRGPPEPMLLSEIYPLLQNKLVLIPNPPVAVEGTPLGDVDISRLNDITRYEGYDAVAQIARDITIAHFMGLIKIKKFRGQVSPYTLYRKIKKIFPRGAVKVVDATLSDWLKIKNRLRKLKEGQSVGDEGQIAFYEAVFREDIKKKHLGSLYSALPKEVKERQKWGQMSLNYEEVKKLREEARKITSGEYEGDDGQIAFYEAVFGKEVEGRHLTKLYSVLPKEVKERQKWSQMGLNYEEVKKLREEARKITPGEYEGDDGQIAFYEAVFREGIKKKHLGSLYSALPKEVKVKKKWGVLTLNYKEVKKLREEARKITPGEYEGDDGQIAFYEDVFGEGVEGKHLANLYSVLPKEVKERQKWSQMSLNYEEVKKLREEARKITPGEYEGDDGQIAFYEAVFGKEVEGRHLTKLYSVLPKEVKEHQKWGVLTLNYKEVKKLREEARKITPGEYEGDDGQIAFYKDVFGEDVEGKHLGSLYTVIPKELKKRQKWTQMSLNYQVAKKLRLESRKRLKEVGHLHYIFPVEIGFFEGIAGGPVDSETYVRMHNALPKEVKAKFPSWNTRVRPPEVNAASLGKWNALDEALKTLHTADLDEIQGDVTLGIILEEKFEASPGLRDAIKRRGPPEPMLLSEIYPLLQAKLVLIPNPPAAVKDTPLGDIDLSKLNDITRYEDYDAVAQIARDLTIAHFMGLIRIKRFRGQVSPRSLHTKVRKQFPKGTVKKIGSTLSDWLEIKRGLEKLDVEEYEGDEGQLAFYETVFGKEVEGKHLGSLYSALPEDVKREKKWSVLNLNYRDVKRVRTEAQKLGAGEKEGDEGQLAFYETVFGKEVEGKHLGNLYSALPEDVKREKKWSQLNLNYRDVKRVRAEARKLGAGEKEGDEGQLAFYETVFGKEVEGKHLGSLYSALPEDVKREKKWSQLHLNYRDVKRVRTEAQKLGRGEKEGDEGQLAFYETVFGKEGEGKHLGSLYSALPEDVKREKKWSVLSLNYREVKKLRDESRRRFTELKKSHDSITGQREFFREITGGPITAEKHGRMYYALPKEVRAALPKWRSLVPESIVVSREGNKIIIDPTGEDDGKIRKPDFEGESDKPEIKGASLGEVDKRSKAPEGARHLFQKIAGEYGNSFRAVLMVVDASGNTISLDLAQFFPDVYEGLVAHQKSLFSEQPIQPLQEFLESLTQQKELQALFGYLGAENHALVITGPLAPEALLTHMMGHTTVVVYYDDEEYKEEFETVMKQMLQKGSVTEKAMKQYGYFVNLNREKLTQESFLEKFLEGKRINFDGKGLRSMGRIAHDSGAQIKNQQPAWLGDTQLIDSILKTVLMHYGLPLEKEANLYESKEGKRFYHFLLLSILGKLAQDPEALEREGLVALDGKRYHYTERFIESLLNNAFLQTQVAELMATMA